MSPLVSIEEVREALGERGRELSYSEAVDIAVALEILARWALNEAEASRKRQPRPRTCPERPAA